MINRRSFLTQSLLLAGTGIWAQTKKVNDKQIIYQFFDSGLAHFSYAVLVDKKIILIDPARDAGSYYTFAKEHGATIIGVIETHPHADFVSSHLEIANYTKAKIYISKLQKASFEFEPFDTGNTIRLSPSISLKALSTPGHSPDSISVVLEKDKEPHAVFTGDSLLFGSVGRPDLRTYSGEFTTQREQLAKQQFHTMHDIFALFPDKTLVYPAHGAGSHCGNAIRNVKESTIREEKRTNPAFTWLDEDEFVRQLLLDQPNIPQYFPYNVELNKLGANELHKALSAVPILDNNYWEESALFIDTRPSSAFRIAHRKGALNIPDADKFETWLGTLIAPHQGFYVVVSEVSKIKPMLLKTAKIGYEVFVKGIFVYNQNSADLSIDDFDSDLLRDNQDRYTIIDVRTEKEAKDKYFDKVINIPLSELTERLQEIPDGKTVLVHCASGYRSGIAASLILRLRPELNIMDISNAITKF
ncbi:MBL fold metallo-hydrolase [Sphingobacterium anhuiense]|uniref:MBL fold metallo-hydrolase n=1 Tax=Sphingobacterium anhuiense TaxID=493780 RepID=UPI003C2F104D